jgi:protoporphyrinogen oxidase
MMGLTIALRLAERGQRVTVFEAAPEIGGLAAAWKLNDVTWDKHYHVTLLSDSWTRGLLATIGLESQMKWVVTRTAFHIDGRLAPLSSAIDYLRLPGIGPVAKARLAATILYASRVQNWEKLEQIPVDRWLTRLSGRRAFERVWKPLLMAKIGRQYESASTAFIWATIQRLYAARRAGLKREMFGFVPGGYATVLARCATHLEGLGVTLRTATPIRQIVPSLGELQIDTPSGSERFDRVVVTTTPKVAARLCATLTEAEQRALEAIRYQGIVCVSLLLDAPISDAYLTYLASEETPITAVVDMSAFVGTEQIGNHGLVYLPRYAPADDPVFTLSDDEIIGRFSAALESVYPEFASRRVHCARISRVSEVFPLPTLGYSRHLPAPETSVPGLFLVSSAHIVNGTLNVNDTVRVAEGAAESLLSSEGNRININRSKAA